MSKAIRLIKLTDIALAQSVLASPDEPGNEYIIEFNERVKSKTIESPLYLLLTTYEGCSATERKSITNYAFACDLTQNSLLLAEQTTKFHGNARSKVSIREIDKCVALLCLFIELTTTIKHTLDITDTCWDGIINDLKNPNSTFKEKVKEKFQVGVRRLAYLLTTLTSNSHFQEVARVKRLGAAGSFTLQQAGLATSAPHLNEWRELYQKYLNEERHLKNTKFHYKALDAFCYYLCALKYDSDPLIFISKPDKANFYNFLKNEGASKPKAIAALIYRFTNWIIDSCMSDFDPDTGDKLLAGVPIFTSGEYSRILNENDPNIKPSESVKLAMPTSWLIMCKNILTEHDFSWPKSIPSEYFDYLDPKTGKKTRTWVPVHTYIYLTMMEIPVRRMQVVSLDSGEGDIEEYDWTTKSWKQNESIPAKYWAYSNQEVKNRGVITKLYSNGKETAGIYINTNKTQDRDKGFSENSGYVIPWNNEYLFGLFTSLRQWQEKYNTAYAPTKYKNIPKSVFGQTPTDSVLAIIPDRFYLFRSPLSCDGLHPNCPPSYNQTMRFWWALMQELERRLIGLGEKAEIVTKINKTTGQPERTIFTPHGLRVTGLTALSEAGVPIEVLSKIIAGHATILMTLYYLKYDCGHITEILNDAQKKIEENSQLNMQRWLKNAVWEDAKRYTIANQADGLDAILDRSAPYTIWGGSSFGICPYGGTRCNDGGALIRKINNTEIYSPVPGGPKNCVRCRHLVTGTPWMIPLWLHGNKLLLDAQHQSKQIDNLQEKHDALTKERYKYVREEKSGSIPAELSNEIRRIGGILEAKTNALDELLYNAHATYNLLEKIKSIPSTTPYDVDSGTKQIELMASKRSDIQFSEISEFKALDLLVQSSRLYLHIEDENYEAERDMIIDKIMFKNNLTPISFSPLSVEEKKLASDAAAKILTTAVDDFELKLLSEGAISLEGIGNGGGIKLQLCEVAPKDDPTGLLTWQNHIKDVPDE